jgi:hypothetical protein
VAAQVGVEDEAAELGGAVVGLAEVEHRVGHVHVVELGVLGDPQVGVALLLHDPEEDVGLVVVAVLGVDHRGADDAAGLVLEDEQEAAAGVEVGGAAERGERAGEQVVDELALGRQVEAVEVAREVEDRVLVARAASRNRNMGSSLARGPRSMTSPHKKRRVGGAAQKGMSSSPGSEGV